MVATITAPLFWPMIRNVIMTCFFYLQRTYCEGLNFHFAGEEKKRGTVTNFAPSQRLEVEELYVRRTTWLHCPPFPFHQIPCMSIPHAPTKTSVPFPFPIPPIITCTCTFRTIKPKKLALAAGAGRAGHANFIHSPAPAQRSFSNSPIEPHVPAYNYVPRRSGLVSGCNGRAPAGIPLFVSVIRICLVARGIPICSLRFSGSSMM
jgi:hypothetical protein